MSLPGSILSRPVETTWRRVRCNSAASSVPVAPAPITVTWSWPGRTGPAWVCARSDAFTRRWWKRTAWSWVSRAIACSATPGVPKSLVVEPTAITSVSYGDRALRRDLAPLRVVARRELDRARLRGRARSCARSGSGSRACGRGADNRPRGGRHRGCRRRPRGAAASRYACGRRSTSVMCARLPRPSLSPSFVTSWSPAAPPPTTTTRCRPDSFSTGTIDTLSSPEPGLKRRPAYTSCVSDCHICRPRARVTRARVPEPAPGSGGGGAGLTQRVCLGDVRQGEAGFRDPRDGRVGRRVDPEDTGSDPEAD